MSEAQKPLEVGDLLIIPSSSWRHGYDVVRIVKVGKMCEVVRFGHLLFDDEGEVVTTEERTGITRKIGWSRPCRRKIDKYSRIHEGANVVEVWRKVRDQIETYHREDRELENKHRAAIAQIAQEANA